MQTEIIKPNCLYDFYVNYQLHTHVFLIYYSEIYSYPDKRKNPGELSPGFIIQMLTCRTLHVPAAYADIGIVFGFHPSPD